ncbi:phage holin family protein [Idiomarina xiamenensis]|uniref:Phage holin family protein n=1 Tax=Idiomarina xiamenensis 10-D-4 TaxID=740709 RepID=K2KAJ0_9GAMM|nr:phage holin family protein [Idiomarina xiamenensis]EKE79939.1 hypothetical protein A10D4_12183 [Idiomarina xiamenensis 10-D-4]
MSDSSEPSLRGLGKGYWQWLGNWLELAQLEGRLVVLAAVKMLALSCAVAVLAVTGWLLLIATIAVAAWQLGLPVVPSLLLAGLLCVVTGWLLWNSVKRNAQRLRFDVTLQEAGLKPREAEQADNAKHADSQTESDGEANKERYRAME